MDVSVVVPTYNQADLLEHSLRSLVDQSLPSHAYEIVVVDDGSTDRTAVVLGTFGPPVRVVRLPANRGRSAARNAGIREARAKLIVLTDSDIIVRENFLASHLSTQQREGPGILSRGPVIDVATVDQARRGPIPKLAPSPAFLTTANAAVEKAALVRAGLFDEAFPGYGWEDFDLGLRLRRIGLRRIFCKDAVAFHVEPREQKVDVSALLRKEEARAKSAVYFFAKHPTFEVRVLIQATRFHRTLYWLQTAGGSVTTDNIASVVSSLRRIGWNPLARVLQRGVLNRHYLRTLTKELQRGRR
jgi:GT2 family glycosyltransferase